MRADDLVSSKNNKMKLGHLYPSIKYQRKKNKRHVTCIYLESKDKVTRFGIRFTFFICWRKGSLINLLSIINQTFASPSSKIHSWNYIKQFAKKVMYNFFLFLLSGNWDEFGDWP